MTECTHPGRRLAFIFQTVLSNTPHLYSYICPLCFLRMLNYLKLVLLAAEIGSLLLPKVVRLDDQSRVDAVRKVVLQHLQKHILSKLEFIRHGEGGTYKIR